MEFSKHAISRAQERGIEVTPDLMDQLAGSIIRAQAKGATNILAMDTEKAFIINVPNARVITAITQEEMKQNIFTKFITPVPVTITSRSSRPLSVTMPMVTTLPTRELA